MPIVGDSLAKFAHTLSGFPLLIGGIVGAGIGIIAWLNELDAKSAKSLASITALGEGMVAATKQTTLEVTRIQAQAKNDERKVITTTAELEITKSEEVRDKRIAIAQQELQTRDMFGRLTVRLSADALAEIASAEKAHLDRRRVIQAQTAADLKKLNEDQHKASLEWLDKEIARLREADDAARTFARAKAAAAFESQLGAAQRGGDPVAEAKARFDQQSAALKQSLDDQIQIQADKLQKGEIMDREFDARKRELIELTAQRQAELDAQFVDNQQKAYRTVDVALRSLLDRLGPGFEDLTEKLDISEAVQASRESFQTIEAAFEDGRLSAAQAAEAVRIVTEQLLAQGATIRDIASVVPQELKTLSSLFRDVQSQIEVTVQETGNVQTAMNQLSAAPLLTLTDGWFRAATAAEAYRLKVLEIARIGPITPRAGMLNTGTQATTVILPQEGLSAEDRRVLADQMADDERRGLTGE